MTTTGTGTRGKYARGIASHAAILEAARDVLVERGFHGTSITAIGERCGLTRKGVLHHFEDKEQLVTSVLDDQLDRTAWFEGQIDAGVCVLDIFVGLIEVRIQRPEQVALLIALSAASADPSHPAHDWFSKRYEFHRTGLPEIIRDGQLRGEVRDDLPAEDIALAILSMLEGLLLQWLQMPDAFDPVEMMAMFADTMRPR